MKVAVLWMRFGPYHLARLTGAAEVLGCIGWSVTGIEVASSDHYPWKEARGGSGFVRRTLFPGRSHGDLAADGIRQAVTRALDEEAPDAVVVNGWSVPEARAALGWARRRAGVLTVVMSETKADDSVRRWWKEWFKTRLLSRASAALVGGRLQASYLASLGMPPDRIFPGYDAVDNAHFAEGSDRARAEGDRLRRERGLPPRFFLACTRFLARKNGDGLLRAYAAYRERSADPWGLVLAGSGEEERSWKALAADGGIAGVHWPGFLQYEELPSWYGIAGAFIHPARAEPWGLVVNEAAASGLPLLVARPVGAAAELVEEGSNGFLFDPASEEEMCGALVRVAGMAESDRRSMGRRSREIAGRWSPRRFGEGLRDALAAGPRGAR